MLELANCRIGESRDGTRPYGESTRKGVHKTVSHKTSYCFLNDRLEELKRDLMKVALLCFIRVSYGIIRSYETD